MQEIGKGSVFRLSFEPVRYLPFEKRFTAVRRLEENLPVSQKPQREIVITRRNWPISGRFVASPEQTIEFARSWPPL